MSKSFYEKINLLLFVQYKSEHVMVKVCGPTTMKPAFYTPVLVLFLVSKRNLFLPTKFLVRKQNKDGL